MSLFGKKNTEEQKSCCCGGETESCCTTTNTSEQFLKDSAEMGIKGIAVLGSGCKSCHALFENTKAAVSELGLETEVEYITDLEKIMSYGVMSMPALVVNGKVVSMGKVLKSKEIVELLNKQEV